MNQRTERALLGAAGTAFVVAVLTLLIGGYLKANQFDGDKLPWALDHLVITVLGLALAGGLIGWFVGVSIPDEFTEVRSRCPKCGTLRRVEDQFCSRCGERFTS